jgi:hypothetical protein
MTKLLVGLGGGKSKNMEIIDLESSSTICQNLPNFSAAMEVTFGGLGLNDEPVICGGQEYRVWQHSNKCFALADNEWIVSPSLRVPRAFAAVSPSPYPSRSQKFFVTGGLNDLFNHNTAEVLTEQGWKTLPQSLPVTIFGHCSVLINSTTVMVIGGLQNKIMSSKTFYFNTENEVWTEGPQLKNKRADLSCGRIRKNSQSQELSVIVAGGWNGAKILSSVEILDLGSNEWRKGSDLSFGIDHAKMVEDLNGGVILVGGRSVPNPGDEDSQLKYYLDTLFQLPHGEANAEWTQMQQKLKYPRFDHVAFLVPDNIVNCS